MLLIIINALVYGAHGFPRLEVIDAYFIDGCDGSEREELCRMQSMISAANNGVRVEVHKMDNTNIPLAGVAYAHIS